MQSFADWLRTGGLECYAPVFTENGSSRPSKQLKFAHNYALDVQNLSMESVVRLFSLLLNLEGSLPRLQWRA